MTLLRAKSTPVYFTEGPKPVGNQLDSIISIKVLFKVLKHVL
jgi:hypothetical protein